MDTRDTVKLMYFQYVTGLNYPIFISFSEKDFEREEMGVFLEGLGFSPVDEKKVKSVQEEDPHFRILKLTKAGGRIAQQIAKTHSTSGFGPERIDQGKGFQIYRYKNCAMVIFSFRSKEWEAGVLETFGADPQITESKIVINRFLSWSLSAIGVCGVWGQKSDEGMVVMRADHSKGSCVFFDIENQVLITKDVVEPLNSDFKFIRINKTLHNKRIAMSREDLLSFLPMHSSYFSPNGLSVPVRQLISKLAITFCGEVISLNSFEGKNEGKNQISTSA